MVKALVWLLFLVFSSSANELTQTPSVTQVIETQSPLIEKIKTFVSEEEYVKNEAYIKLIFSPQSDFYKQSRVDVVKVAGTLKENGLLNLFFKKPQELKLSFKTSGSPLFFVKVMGDTLRNIGYYRYVTTESNLDSSEFTWSILLTSEYATDPLILQEELQKSKCSISDIVRNTQNNWEYTIDVSEGSLNLDMLENNQEHILKRSLYAHWLNVSQIQNLRIKSSFRDHWYPKIVYYDKQLHLLEVIDKNRKTRSLSLVIPKNAEYIKISDMYTLKNVKDKLTLEPIGSR